MRLADVDFEHTAQRAELEPYSVILDTDHFDDENPAQVSWNFEHVRDLVVSTGCEVTISDRDWLGIPVVADINRVFNFEVLSFSVSEALSARCPPMTSLGVYIWTLPLYKRTQDNSAS
ncbi:hypothetical protein CONLIGDRAFT_692503 [Coniochaeta ligniaria NRRL 30616]|uniref:Uncharacterized protein n=1 Tax=Coniochaeta ligniaria NRRL 30616 TaxID=1408157 RepID=A0A1J7J599_9PEZI|nr:hypothetical protein CONLIGDRAFT_692503 [Coniochaeta ligniaria NRRL 30616]